MTLLPFGMNEIDLQQYGFADAKLYSCKYPKAEELNPILLMLTLSGMILKQLNLEILNVKTILLNMVMVKKYK